MKIVEKLETTGRKTGKMRPDTRAILRVAAAIELLGLVCAGAVWAGGGLTVHGPHTDIGWLWMIVALGCLPTGTFFLLLGTAKWLGDGNRVD
jgi:hypothetical protein